MRAVNVDAIALLSAALPIYVCIGAGHLADKHGLLRCPEALQVLNPLVMFVFVPATVFLFLATTDFEDASLYSLVLADTVFKVVTNTICFKVIFHPLILMVTYHTLHIYLLREVCIVATRC